MDYYIQSILPKKLQDDVFPIQQFMEFTEDTYDVLGSSFLKEMQDLPPAGELKVSENMCRFDNLAYEMMGSSDYWWLVMELNERITWDVGPNEILKIPDLSEITFLKNSLVIKENRSKYSS